MNRAELLSDVREAFEQLEAAISSATPQRCQGFVAPRLYEQLLEMLGALAAAGRRRVHGAFEVTAAQLIAIDSDAPRARVRIEATSSLMQLDQGDRIAEGSDQPMSWTQEVVAERPPGSEHWRLLELGEMRIAGPVAGPTGLAVRTPEPTELEKQERASIEHAAAVVASGLNFMSLRHPPRL